MINADQLTNEQTKGRMDKQMRGHAYEQMQTYDDIQNSGNNETGTNINGKVNNYGKEKKRTLCFASFCLTMGLNHRKSS